MIVYKYRFVLVSMIALVVKLYLFCSLIISHTSTRKFITKLHFIPLQCTWYQLLCVEENEVLRAC